MVDKSRMRELLGAIDSQAQGLHEVVTSAQARSIVYARTSQIRALVEEARGVLDQAGAELPPHAEPSPRPRPEAAEAPKLPDKGKKP